MFDSGGNGYTGTDWSTAAPIDMWLAIGNQETTGHWTIVRGWKKSYELTYEHMNAVISYRNNLAEAWPTSSNNAAGVYIGRLNKLIADLETTYKAAAANYTAMFNATSSLEKARATLGPIVDEYYANDAALAQFNKSKTQLTPGHGKSVVPAPKPPVPDGRQEQLAAEARSVMYTLGADLVTAKGQLSQPTLYTPGAGDHKSDDEIGNTTTAPTLPAVIPFDPHSSSSAAAPGIASTQFHTASPHASAGTIATPIHQPGLVLGGVGTQTTPTPSIPVPTTTTIGPSGLPGVISPTAPPPGSTLDFPRSPSTFGGSRGLPGEATFEKSGAGGASGLHSIAPGGVIGGQPGVGRTASSARSMQKVNPIGGVISSSGESTAHGVAGGRSSEAFGAAGGQVGRRREDGEAMRWDPDNPWETAEGVDPIVLPVAEQRIDPGPAIGLD